MHTLLIIMDNAQDILYENVIVNYFVFLTLTFRYEDAGRKLRYKGKKTIAGPKFKKIANPKILIPIQIQKLKPKNLNCTKWHLHQLKY